MENISKLLNHEQARDVVAAARAIARGRSEALSEELVATIFPLPYSSLEDVHSELMTSLLQKMLVPYL